MITLLFLDRRLFFGSLCILLNCSLIMSFLIESVDDCGRHSCAKWLVEAGPRLGVQPEITGLRHTRGLVS